MGSDHNLTTRSTRIDLSRIQEGTHPLVLDGRGQALEIDPEAHRKFRDFVLEGELSFDGTDYRVRGSLTGTLETACDRCLTPFERQVSSEVDRTVEIGPPAPGRGGAGSEVAPPRVLDLAGPLEEAVLLEIPIKNLCREECRGICPTCGGNRNVEACDCDPVSRDPRWDALKGLSFSIDPEE